jgi:hypothetical protein
MEDRLHRLAIGWKEKELNYITPASVTLVQHIMKAINTPKESTAVLEMKGICIEFFSAYQELDINRMLGLCTSDGLVYFEPLEELGTGLIHEVGKNIWTTLIRCFPDIDNTVIQQEWIEEFNAVRCRVRIFGTQKKEFLGIPANDLRFDSDHIFIFKFNDQTKIREIRVLWNHEKFLQQLIG